MRKYILAIFLFASFVFFLLLEGKKQGRQEQMLQNAQEQNKVQNEIIETTKQVVRRKQINRSADIDTDLEWLQNSICPDCNS